MYGRDLCVQQIDKSLILSVEVHIMYIDQREPNIKMFMSSLISIRTINNNNVSYNINSNV